MLKRRYTAGGGEWRHIKVNSKNIQRKEAAIYRTTDFLSDALQHLTPFDTSFDRVDKK